MSREEGIVHNLTGKFNYLEGHLRVPRPRRISVEVGLENFREVFDHLVKQLNFTHLCTITGLDELDKFSAIYHLAQDTGVLLNLKTSFPKEKPVINTVTEYFLGADIYERELMDLFGIEVKGLPKGGRYPLPDDWPVGQHPLRKDWKPSLE